MTRPSRDVASLAPLADPVRRRLYEAVARADDAQDRDAAAAAVGIGRPLAAFHLDRLVAAGLLEVEFRRRSGRSGPGAGRPAKFYRRASREVEVSLPPRRYDLAAAVLADGIAAGPVPEAALDAIRAAAARRGAQLVHGAHDETPRERLRTTLDGQGYEPVEEADGRIRLRNCPFHALAEEHRDLACPMNLAMLDGLAGAIPGAGVRVVPDPRPGWCCVAFVPGT